MIFTAGQGDGTPGAAECQQIREFYGLTMPVLIDPDDVFRDTLQSSRGDNFIMDRNLEITFRGRHNTGAAEDALVEVLTAK